MLVPIDYLMTPFAIICNSVIIIILIYSAKKRLAVYLSLCSGNHYVDGTITYSEYGTFARNTNLLPEALITYKYQVNGIDYHQQFSNRAILSQQYFANMYSKGTNIKVYYSPVNPSISSVDTVPIKTDTVASIIFWHFVIFILSIATVYWLYEKFSP